ncbi:FAD-dependent oxidoreductase, partial [Myxococcota bacterium]|nr:FAD-dependent oxidoreductase [Myxococcota bacterium]
MLALVEMSPPLQSQPARQSGEKRDIVLVGGGHAHIQVIRKWMMEPIPEARLTVIVDRYPALYSGMLPGVVAGEYRLEDTVIDLRPLCLRAGARCSLGRATRIHPETRKIEVAGRPAVRYDLASIDIGSSVRGDTLPGVEEHTIATRPIGRFMSALEETLAKTASTPQPLQVVVVGAGAAGMELALCLRTRLGHKALITLLTRGTSVLEGMNQRLGKQILQAAQGRKIRIQTQVEVQRVEADRLYAHGPHGESITVPADLTLWATGAAPAPLGADSALPLSADGFIRTDPYLRVCGHENLYAVGDCAVPDHAAQLPRAGVHAVRQGPVLDANLRAQCLGRRLKPYRPQSDFLALLNLGDGRAAGGKWGLAASSRFLRRLKHRIDSRFMERFRVLDSTGQPAASFPRDAAMEEAAEAMLCGGCAAKVGPSPLQNALRLLP